MVYEKTGITYYEININTSEIYLVNKKYKIVCVTRAQTLEQLPPWWKNHSGLKTQHLDSNSCQNKNKDLTYQSP